MNKEKLKQQIISQARLIGFDLIGFSSAKLWPGNYKKYCEWLKKNYEGEMAYMRKKDLRKSPQKVLPGAKTVISLAINYYHEQKLPNDREGIIARYAYGRDYHKIIRKKLRELERFIGKLAASVTSSLSPPPNSSPLTKSYVDTGPFFDRAFAVQSGLGQIGKNSCLITKEFGSWVFLAEIITTLIIPGDFAPTATAPQSPFSICGTCTRCIDSCPTKAIVTPGVIDSRKCLAYQTIENKKPPPPEIVKKIAETKRLFGCDICQEVCPHNCRAKAISHKELKDPKIAGSTQNLSRLLAIKTDEEFLAQFAGSPLMRAKREKLQDSAKIIHS